MAFGTNPRTGLPGPSPKPPRDGDAVQARQRINVEVRTGRWPHPNELPCADCGHAWKAGERRHEYDHHLGYAAAHHYDVQAVCVTCHGRRGRSRACKRGHTWTVASSVVGPDGRRRCRICRRAKERRTRDAAWWRARRVRAKEASHG